MQKTITKTANGPNEEFDDLLENDYKAFLKLERTEPRFAEDGKTRPQRFADFLYERHKQYPALLQQFSPELCEQYLDAYVQHTGDFFQPTRDMYAQLAYWKFKRDVKFADPRPEEEMHAFRKYAIANYPQKLPHFSEEDAWHAMEATKLDEKGMDARIRSAYAPMTAFLAIVAGALLLGMAVTNGQDPSRSAQPPSTEPRGSEPKRKSTERTKPNWTGRTQQPDRADSQQLGK